MTNPVIIMALIEGGAIASVGIGSLVAQTIARKRLKERLKHMRGRRPKTHKRRLILGEPRDAVFIADTMLKTGDKAVNSIIHQVNRKVHNKKLRKSLTSGYDEHRFQKNFKWLENQVEKKAGYDIKHQSALRRWFRVQKQLGDKAVLDRSLKSVKNVLK